MPITHSRDIDEESDLAAEFVRDAKAYINFLKSPVVFGFEVKLADTNTAHITAKYAIQGFESYDQIHTKDVNHLVHALSHLGFSVHQVIQALKVLIYDYSRFSDLNKKNYNYFDESAKLSFIKDAELIICHLCPEITD